jgi:NAD(P)-dependent dehydrogenase (short-subunit alcohol dehydrogenase family)
MPSIFITGASRGLGLEFVRQYAAAGWSVTAACRDPSRATDLARLGVETVALDLADPDSIRRAAQTLQGRSFDILLNNAGLYGEGQQFGRLSQAEWERVMLVNAIAPLKLTEAFLPHLMAGQKKLMVFLTSKMGSIADNSSGGAYIYRSSKAALNAAVKSLSIDLEPRGVTILLLHPGWVQTDMGGPNALISAEQSVACMRRQIEAVEPGQTLKFVDYEGTPLPW